MGLFGVGLGLDFMAYFYLGFADGLFGLHYLRFNLRIFMVVLVLLCCVCGCVILCRIMAALVLV